MSSIPAPRLILGIINLEIAALNERNRIRREEKRLQFRALLDQEHIAQIAENKQLRSISKLQLASSPTALFYSFHNILPYEQEVLDLAEADSDLVWERRKISSAIFQAQKDRAGKLRVKFGDSEQPLRTHVLELISQRERRQETVLELWPHFICRLRELGCDPKEYPESNRRPTKVEYDFPRSKNKRNSEGDPVRTISFRTFQNLVSELRKNHFSRDIR
jgi:hypothetical protein